MNGVAISVSPMPAMEMTRIFTAAKSFPASRSWICREQTEPKLFSTGRFHGAALVLVQRLQRVIAAFHVDVRLGGGEKFRGRRVGEDADAVHALQRGQHGGAVSLGIHRAVGAFQAAHGGIAVHAEEQGVAEIAGVLQIGDVAEVQDVEAAVGDDEFLPLRESYFATPATGPTR